MKKKIVAVDERGAKLQPKKRRAGLSGTKLRGKAHTAYGSSVPFYKFGGSADAPSNYHMT